MAGPALRKWRLSARSAETSSTIFLILRRMRAPLIVLITIFAVSVLGLTLIPGRDEAGHAVRMGFFDAFYFMSYTATTIGYGEIPQPFTGGQRLWVMATIYLTVVGWAYAIGSLLTLLQDRAFRQALALQRFTRTVARLREPFLLIVGYGQTGQLLGRSLDAIGRRFVVLDASGERVDVLDIDSYHADVPGLAADAGDPQALGVAGLGHPRCEGVLALTDDDEVNLVVAMTAALLRPGLPVIARTVSPAIEQRMRAFGSPAVVNPFDRFGDHLRVALRSPASYQLMSWLESGPGAELPQRGRPPTAGRWVICGYGRFGRKLADDLRAEGLEITVIDVRPDAVAGPGIVGDASEPAVMARAELDRAVGFVAGTDNDTTNLSLIAAARRINPALFIASRQNRPASAPLFAAMDTDRLLVPTETVAREIYAQLSTPLLWRFLQDMPGRGDDWAAGIIDRLTRLCGPHLGSVWKVELTSRDAPALEPYVRTGDATVGGLLRSPQDRDQSVAAVPLLLHRDSGTILGPDGDITLEPGDQLLLAGRPSARRALLDTMTHHAVSEYVLTGRTVPSGWLWQRVTGKVPRRPSS
ncbi:NAD-binding protein [Couchioplanes caeruleus]|uniref:potassium channel family protein n=1 Tax=Couchioplanes caeruleus TaxID=56438 RepID=UPI00201C0BF6|nr:potassium channel protein [Couchioplanes caeruleus]UQU62794.1 NAD-binding protein [Couchioplanes caeruleus]